MCHIIFSLSPPPPDSNFPSPLLMSGRNGVEKFPAPPTVKVGLYQRPIDLWRYTSEVIEVLRYTRVTNHPGFMLYESHQPPRFYVIRVTEKPSKFYVIQESQRNHPGFTLYKSHREIIQVLRYTRVTEKPSKFYVIPES